MRFSDLPKHCWLLPILFFGFLLSQVGAVAVFPMGPFSVWLLLASADTAIRLIPGDRFQRGRFVLWACTALYFTSYAKMPLLGLFFLIAPSFFWVESKRRDVRVWVLVLLGFLVLAQIQKVDVLLALRWAGLFYCLRLFSWYQFVIVRGEKLSFFDTMEYFLSPAFFLFPLGSSFLTLQKFRQKTEPEYKHLIWIFMGLVFALLAFLQVRYSLDWMARSYLVRTWETIFVLPALVLLFWLTFAKISYLSAGFLSFSGHDISPDFRAPWKATTLRDFFSRFHYWVHDYFFEMEKIQIPVWNNTILKLFLFLFLLFCPFISLEMAAAYSGIFTVFLFLSEQTKKWPIIALPVTYCFIIMLAWLAFPIFYLNWGFAQFFQFWS